MESIGLGKRKSLEAKGNKWPEQGLSETEIKPPAKVKKKGNL